MKVLHVVPHLDSNGNGVVNSFKNLAAEQIRRGTEIVVFSRSGGLLPYFTSRGAAFYELSRRGTRLTRTIESARGLRRAIAHERPDVVHIHAGGSLPLALLGTYRTGVPTVATAHSLFRKREYVVLLADVALAVSQQNAARLRRLRTGNVRVAENGVETSANPVRYDATRVPKRIVFVGGLFRRKGVDVLVRAFRDAQDVPGENLHLDIVGEGPHRADFEQLASILEVTERVTFHGFQADAREFIRRASVFVLPSREEPFGLVLAEARMEGVPIIGSAVGGIPEVLAHGEAGILVSPDSPQALAEAIIRVTHNPSIAEDYARRAYQGSERWGVGQMTDSVERVYQELLVRKRRRL